ncbi:DUF3108 domain-containing protein [Sabulicella glaciei]|uniref:DUF3108 domain-containing protein n=2 Tax=Sabulicella glaciei TaxID=2984948 RepID=A0ABT3NXH5_9PROT|nr:DUF3108 domain-containing protein [Roseococcus sp. MDT2-1-1]MCW8086882.1 DUF3108 domain-containing protein [Roseococcus sp. MDT2-1-1]
MPLLLAMLLLLAIPAAATPWRAEYAVTLAGVTVMEAQVTFDLDGPGYWVESRSRSRGLASLVARGAYVTRASGSWRGDAVAPRRYATEGQTRGSPRRIVIDYENAVPRVRVLDPVEDVPRTPIPEDALPGTVDSLSALAMLARQVSRTARCDASARMFDARRLTLFAARTVGQEADGLRCELESRHIAGIPTQRDPVQAAQPQIIHTWFVRPHENGPAIPGRVEIATRWWGRVEAHLIRLEPARAT